MTPGDRGAPGKVSDRTRSDPASQAGARQPDHDCGRLGPCGRAVAMAGRDDGAQHVERAAGGAGRAAAGGLGCTEQRRRRRRADRTRSHSTDAGPDDASRARPQVAAQNRRHVTLPHRLRSSDARVFASRVSRRPAQGRCPSHAGADLAHPRCDARHAGVHEGREPAAHGCVQVSRRLQLGQRVERRQQEGADGWGTGHFVRSAYPGTVRGGSASGEDRQRHLPAGRKARLAAYVAEAGQVTVTALAERFGVSIDTIRRAD